MVLLLTKRLKPQCGPLFPNNHVVVWFSTLIFLQLLFADAQIYRLEDAFVPANRTLDMLHAFYMYSKDDAPKASGLSGFLPSLRWFSSSGGDAVHGHGGQFPHIWLEAGPSASSLHHLGTGTPSAPPSSPNEDHALEDQQEKKSNYHGIQLTLMLYEDFLQYVNKSDFCCWKAEAEDKKCAAAEKLKFLPSSGTVPGSQAPMIPPASNNIVPATSSSSTLEKGRLFGAPNHTFVLDLAAGWSAGSTSGGVGALSSGAGSSSSQGQARPLQHLLRDTANITKSGVYLLLLSNCGWKDGFQISGSVGARNAYGYLPGQEYHKLGFFGSLVLVYGLLLALWLNRCFQWWRELFPMQGCIGSVLFLGLLECSLWYVCLNTWNTTGTRPRTLFLGAILVTVVKSVWSYTVLLLACLGWGITRATLRRATTLQIQIFTFAYLVLGCIRELVLQLAQSYVLPLSFVLLTHVPVALLHGGILYWISLSLSDLIAALERKRQTEKLVLFQRLWRVLVLGVLVVTVAQLYTMVLYTRKLRYLLQPDQWGTVWTCTDGIFHIVFLGVLLTMMRLWWPDGQTHQRYAYSQQIEQYDDENISYIDHYTGSGARTSQLEVVEEEDEGSSASQINVVEMVPRASASSGVARLGSESTTLSRPRLGSDGGSAGGSNTVYGKQNNKLAEVG